MQASVACSKETDPVSAGLQAVADALKKADRALPCHLVLLFSTAHYHPGLLRDTVASVVGGNVPILGGCVVDAMTNEYSGGRDGLVALALIWFEDGMACDFFAEGDLAGHETEAGQRLGERLASAGVTKDTATLLFYDAMAHTDQSAAIAPLLDSVSQRLGFLPNLIGACLIADGNADCPVWQWTGLATANNHVSALAFDMRVRLDSVTLHGCRPGTGYYRISKTDGRTILEINEQPALPFIEKILSNAIPPETYPSFLLFGVNHGGKFDPLDEADINYAIRRCVAIDPARQGIIVSEPDMTPGVEFQIMYPGLDLAYMPARIGELFERLGGRVPALALYINFAGCASRYAGLDADDAFVIQEIVGRHIPLIGIYTGPVLAPLNGLTRSLDLTGLFCLFSFSR